MDLQSFPVNMIDRVEVLADGASTIYGSDAIAGTINVITRDRFEGAEFTFRHGFTSKGDAEFENVMMVAGANTADGKGNVTFSAEWYRQGGLAGTARPRFSEGDNDVFFGTTAPGRAEIFRNNRINLFTFGGVPSPSGSFIGSFVRFQTHSRRRHAAGVTIARNVHVLSVSKYERSAFSRHSESLGCSPHERFLRWAPLLMACPKISKGRT